MKMASHHYCYKPLPRHGKHIRLLTLFPTRDNRSIIRTSLTVHSIPSLDATRREKLWAYLFLPSYSAISYRWIPGKQQSILVSGMCFDVDENVHDALRVLRSYTSMPLRFWIDCICINQKDDKEKSEQIPLMPYVYGLSRLTLIWLEMPTEESKRAMDYIIRLTKHPYLVRAVYTSTQLHSSTLMTQVDETLLAKLRRIVCAEIIRQGYTLICRISLLLEWVVNTLNNVLGQNFMDQDVVRCRFQTLEEYSLSGSIQEDPTFSAGYQNSLRQGRIHRLQKYAAENGELLSEDVIAQVASQQLTLVESWKDDFLQGFRQGFRQGRIRRLHRTGQLEAAAIAENKVTTIPENASEIVNPVPSPNPGPTSNAIEARKMPTTTNIEGDKKRKIWQPSARALLSIDRNEFKDKAELIESTLFSKTEYFNRMWTLQEVCITRGAAIVHGGPLIFLSDVLRVVQYLESELGIESEHVKKAVRTQWINAEFLLQRRLPLRVLLYESRDRDCGNPRDKIYAVLGLMLERPTILVKPAYDQPEVEVYTNATRFLIATGRSLDIICGHEQQKRLLGYPSWTPDFTQFARDGARPLIDLSGRNTIYKASLREAPQNLLDPTYLPDDWQSLSVEAIYLGTIAHLSSHNSAGENVLQRAHHWKEAIQHRFISHPREFSLLQNAFELVQHCFNYSTDTTAKKLRWLSTPEGSRVLHDLARSLRELEHEKHNLCSKYILTLICGRLDTGTRCGIADIIDLLCQPFDHVQTSTPPPETFYNAIDSGTANRRLFVTENAVIQGAAPSSAKPQDQVFVLVGCSVPVVLRHLSGNGYELVGECYCQGVMDGEAEKNANVRNIVLR
jgi:hypothetical protein